MRRSVLTILALFLAMPLATAIAADENTGTKNRDQQVVAQPTRGALPAVAKSQRRLGSIRVADCMDPENVGDCHPDYQLPGTEAGQWGDSGSTSCTRPGGCYECAFVLAEKRSKCTSVSKNANCYCNDDVQPDGTVCTTSGSCTFR